MALAHGKKMQVMEDALTGEYQGDDIIENTCATSSNDGIGLDCSTRNSSEKACFWNLNRGHLKDKLLNSEGLLLSHFLEDGSIMGCVNVRLLKVVKVLYYLSSERICAEYIVSRGGVPLLIKALRLPYRAAWICSCVVLGRAARFAGEQELQVAIPSLLELLSLHSSAPKEAEVAGFALRKIAEKGEELRCSLIESGALPLLLNMIPQTNCGCQREAMRAMRELVLFSERNQGLFIEGGGLPAIFSVLSSSSLLAAKAPAAEILAALSRYNEVRRLILAHSAIPCLIEATRIGCIASRTRAAHALGLLAFTKRVRKLIVEAGAIPVLIELFTGGNEVAKLVVGNTLGILSSHLDHLCLVARSGAILLLVTLLEGVGGHLGRDIAEDCFCILAISEENAVSITQHLVRVLREGSSESKTAAAGIVWDLSSYRHSVPFIRESGAIPLLIELLKDPNQEMREKLSAAIAELSSDTLNRVSLAEAGAILVLVDLLRDPSDEVKENAAEALRQFAEDPSYQLEMSQACAIPALLDLQNSLFEGSSNIRDSIAAALVHLEIHSS